MFHAKITADPDAGQLLPLAELLGAFSYALEITEGQPPGHCVRACWIGSHVGRALGLAGDAKSPYTGGHSSRVADLTRDLGTALGHTPERRRWLHRGALLHDIGKLGVSNTILDKPARLDADEWRIMRMHSAHTGEILGRIPAFAELGPMAAAHHERLDGAGYPHGLADAAIGLDTRIITTCDIYDALTAERPYRAAMPPDEALAIMRRDVGTAIDARCFEALEAVAE